MRKHILLPTDFSDNAWSAALYAMKLYENEPCTFHFLHSSKLKGSSMAIMTNKLSRIVTEKAQRDLSELKTLAENENNNKNHTFEVILSAIDLQNAIDITIKKEHIDLIILGTKGATKAKEIIFGSNTVDVITHIKNCPVLVIPDTYSYEKPKHIAFPTDFNRAYGDELLPLKQLTSLHNSQIEIMHINNEDNISEKQKQNFDQLKTSLEGYNYNMQWMPGYDTKEKAINDFIKNLNIDVLVMINYEHSFVEDIIKEPVIKNIGFHPNIPFLVIPKQT